MPKNKRPPKRKQHITPVNPVNLVIEGMKRMGEEDWAQIMNPARKALYQLTNGDGTLAAWKVLSGALNIANMVDRMYFHKQYASELAQAFHAHAMCGKRGLELGAYGYTGPELETIKFALDLHVEHLKQLTLRELSDAVDQVNAARIPALFQPKKNNP